MLCVYKAHPDEKLDSLSHHRFQEIVATSKNVIYPESLPSTSGEVKCHIFRSGVKGNSLSPEKQGWKIIKWKMVPILLIWTLLLLVCLFVGVKISKQRGHVRTVQTCTKVTLDHRSGSLKCHAASTRYDITPRHIIQIRG